VTPIDTWRERFAVSNQRAAARAHENAREAYDAREHLDAAWWQDAGARMARMARRWMDVED
jgi:hypothetical protein